MSIHHTAPGFFPISPFSQLPDVSSASFDPFTLALPLMQGASDRTFSTIWPIVENVKDVFAPDYIIVQCGVDSLAGDPCATFNWSLHSLGWCIDRVLNQWQGKKLLLGGGERFHPLQIQPSHMFNTVVARRIQFSQRRSCMDLSDVYCSKAAVSDLLHLIFSIPYSWASLSI